MVSDKRIALLDLTLAVAAVECSLHGVRSRCVLLAVEVSTRFRARVFVETWLFL